MEENGFDNIGVPLSSNKTPFEVLSEFNENYHNNDIIATEIRSSGIVVYVKKDLSKFPASYQGCGQFDLNLGKSRDTSRKILPNP